MRSALEALSGMAAGARPLPASAAPVRLPLVVREPWLGGLADALGEQQVIFLAVTPSALLLAEVPVLGATNPSLPAALHAAGLRALTLWAGAEERELLAVAQILVTDWAATDAPAAALARAVWAADLPHAWFELADQPVAARAPFGAPSAALDRLSAPAEPSARLGTLGAEALAALRDLRATLAPEPSGLLDAQAAPSTLPPDVAAEVALVRTGGDLDPGELGAALLAAIHASDDPATVTRLASALAELAVELLAGAADVGPLVHHALEVVDTDLTPNATLRAAATEAFDRLADGPLRTRLLAAIPAAESPELRGPLFSLLSLVRAPGAVAALAEALPRWALAVLADTVLLRDPEDATGRLDAVRARLASASPAVVALGLAMSSRIDDPRLSEQVLALAEHRDAEVREAVLVALRHHSVTRVRELVLRRLGDPSTPVRIEALRHAVAHRLPEVLPHVEARVQDAAVVGLDDVEARALCIAYGRLAKDAAEIPLSDIALGRRKLGPTLARHALHGLRAIGTARARAALEHVAAEVPRLRDEVAALLGEAR